VFPSSVISESVSGVVSPAVEAIAGLMARSD
jgi:hypothetical protein